MGVQLKLKIMLLTTTTFVCTPETGPKFWLAWTDSDLVTNNSYGYAIEGSHISTGQNYLEVFDTELGLSNRVNEIKNINNWYDTCENRIPPMPGVSDWDCVDEVPLPSLI